ncbi:hypothetical protein RI367_002873 [Sorochytrium milnesiophthora]
MFARRGLTLYNLPITSVQSTDVRLIGALEAEAVQGAEPSSTPPAVQDHRPESDQEEQQDSSDSDDVQPSQRYSCNVCKQTFADVEEQRGHFKSLLHLYNIKRVTRLGLPPTTTADDATEDDMRAELERLRLKDGNESDSSSEDEAATAPASTERSEVWFSICDQPLVAWRHLIGPDIASGVDLYQRLKDIQSRPPKTAMLIASGGNFVAAVFEGARPTMHKSIHRYTTRRKQGGAQSANDGGKGKAKSAGAQIRRYNEAALRVEIRETMMEWQAQLQACSHLFVFAPGSNRQMLFGYENSPIKSGDERIRSLPFQVRKPTYTEALRCFARLISVRVDDGRQDESRPKPSAAVPESSQQPVADHVVQTVASSSESDQDNDDSADGAAKRRKKPRRRVKERNPLLDPEGTGVDLAALEAEEPTQDTAGPAKKSSLLINKNLVGQASLSPEFRLALERERRARAAERRLGATTAASKSVAPQAASTTSTAPDPAPAAPVVTDDKHCRACGQELRKVPLVRGGNRFCSVRCVAKFK